MHIILTRCLKKSIDRNQDMGSDQLRCGFTFDYFVATFTVGTV